MAKKKSPSKIARAIAFWQRITEAAFKKTPYDLSTRQMAILLCIYAEPIPHSIKSISKRLSISKPAVCRAADALEYARLIKRARDRRDQRNVWLQKTAKGSAYLRSFADIILQASKETMFR